MIACIGKSCIDILILSEIIKIISGFVTTITAITLAIVAIFGYNSWKAQLKGKTEYETAKRLLYSLYKVRDSIPQLRLYYITELETLKALKESNIEYLPDGDANSQYLRLEAVYRKRLSKVSSAYQEFNEVAFEAEALWGESAKIPIAKFNSLISILFVTIDNFIDSKRPGSTSEMGDHYKEVIFGGPSKVVFVKKGGDVEIPDEEYPNPYTIKINDAITALENFIKPKLRL